MAAKVLLVLVDGLSYGTAVEQMGYMEGLVAGGTARRWSMECALPSLSRPLYETVHTGVTPHQHGVTSNDTARLSRCEHVFGVARANGRSTGAAAFSWLSELYNAAPYDPVDHRECHDEAQPIQHGRFYSTENYPDQETFHDAELIVRRHRPDYMLVRPMGCDHAGHGYGGESLQYRRKAGAIDDLLSRTIPGWRVLGYDVIVTADHGMDADGHHGGTAEVVRRIPFYLAGRQSGTAEVEQVTQLSVAPTVLALLGLAAPAAMTAPSLLG